MQRSTDHRGFSLLETMIALVLVAFAMTALVLAFGSSSKFGVRGRRQANAVALARSIAGQLSMAAYTDVRLVNNNNQNDANFADPNGVFAVRTLPTGSDPDAPDYAYPNPCADVNCASPAPAGAETYQVYVNVAPLMDPVNVTLEQGRQFAVIVRYQMGDHTGSNEGTFRRAVVLGYRYNPANMGVGQLPL
jgi:prepilin-type N-terminal cleavage/methylation domain-containing protein